MQLIEFVKGMPGQIPGETFQHTNTLSCLRDSCFDVRVKRQLGIKNNLVYVQLLSSQAYYQRERLGDQIHFSTLKILVQQLAFVNQDLKTSFQL